MYATLALLLAVSLPVGAFRPSRFAPRPGLPRLGVVDVQHLADLATTLPSFTLGDGGDTAGAVAGEVTYSKASYYTTLGLYLLSFPGLLSTISRSVKPNPKTKTFEIPGPDAEATKAIGSAARNAVEKAREEGKPAPVMTVGGKPMRETAAEIVAYFQANNYEVASADDVITFRGLAGRSKSQAFFLTFITFLCLGSLGLVLQIQFPFGGQYWYALTLLAPYAGIYYWKNASVENTATVRLETADSGEITDITVRAEKEELDRFQETLGYMEKGMIYVKSIFDSEADMEGQAAATPAASDKDEGKTLAATPSMPQSQEEPPARDM